MTTELRVAKAHAYGNDFLFVEAGAARFNNLQARESDLARQLCARHTGVGGDGLILFELRDRGATMTLFNADGGPAELSGNGLRCLAALIARRQNLRTGDVVTVDTTEGTKTLELKAIAGAQYTFRAALGPPAGIRQAQIPVLGETVTASVLSVGNPQCVVLGPLPDQERFNRFGPALSKHSMALPIAVSSWKTGGEFLFRGSTVFAFLMMGSGMNPPWRSSRRFKRSSRTQRGLAVHSRTAPRWLTWRTLSSEGLTVTCS